MDKLYAPGTIRQLKDRHDFRLSKSLGQNFLTSQHVVDKIIEGSQMGPEDLVVEIGPGMGVLTAAAAKRCGKIIAVEIDSHLLPILEETLADYHNTEVVNRDILKVDLNRLIQAHGNEEGKEWSGVKIIGNLPYYITTPIIMKILEDGVKADSITIMLQKEVADRICASPGSKTYGAISVAVQYYCTVNAVAAVSKEVFFPKPKVDSAVIRLDIRRDKPVELCSEAVFFAVIKAGFGQRRKTLLNALTGVCGKSKEEVSSILGAVGIECSRRAETLSIQEFASLANEVCSVK